MGKASQGTLEDNCWNTIADASGNVYITGYFNSPTITFGTITLTKGANCCGDFYIAKYDASGNALWAASATAATLVNGFSLATDAFGNVYAAGTYYGSPITFGATTLPYLNQREVFLVKYDALGNVLWATGAAGVGGEDLAWGVATDPSGNVYLTGSFDSPTLTFGANTLTNVNSGPGLSDIFLVKYDGAGNVLWAKREGGTAGDVPTDIITDVSGNVYITGGFSSPSLSFGATTLTQTGASFNNCFIVKYDGAGNALWAKQSVQDWKCAGKSLAVNAAGTAVYMTANHHISSPLSFGPFTLPQQGFWDACLVKYDAASGNELCALNMAEPANANSDVAAWGLAVDPSGDVYVTGSARFINASILIGSYTLPIPAGLTPFFIAVFDPNCNVICADALSEGAGGLNTRTAVTADPLGNVYVASTFDNTFTVGTTTLVQTPNFYDVWVAKYVKCTNSTLAVSATQTNPTCNNQCTGTGTANPSGGTAPYTYSWNTSPAQNTQTATGLCAGNYTATVTDASGSTATSNIIITQPTVITANTTAIPASCGSNNGSASVTASGGTGSFTYSWNPSGQTTSTATGLGAGNYTATVTDSNGCTQTATVTVTQTGGPTVTTSTTPQTCTQGGTASASATGGTAPYTYQWCNGQTTSAATNLSAGTCTVIVTDAGGCSTTSTVTITSSGSVPTATVTSASATCGNNNGTATANVSGGTAPYTYQWSSGQSTSAVTGLAGGNYTVIVTDATGCTAVQTINVSQTSAVTATTASTPSSCNSSNGTASVTAGGGASPYTYLWNNGQTVSTATGLSAGNYTVTITDANGCTQTATVAVTQTGGPTAAVASNITIAQGQSATLTASGGGTYSWSNSSTANPIYVSPQTTTVYCVTVTDASNCSDTACVTITVNIEPIPCGELFIPNAFSPNDDGENDVLYVRGNCIKELQFEIYNRWGEKVFETSDQSNGWDGTFKGKTENTSVFVWHLNAVLSNGEKINRKGNVSLIR